MLDTYGFLALVALTTAIVALVVLKLVRRNNWHDVLEPHNDAIGFVYSAIAVLYAVVLGFTLIAVWERFDAAEVVVNDEANAMTNLYIMSSTLPESQRVEIHGLLDTYIIKVVDVEWDAMASSELVDNCACDEVQAIWRWFLTADPSIFPNQTLYDESIATLIELQDHRRTRLNTAGGGLADFILALLVITAVPTILGPCILGVRNATVHKVIVAGAALSISFMVASVFLINQTFSGQVHVEAEALHHVLEVAERFRGN